MTTLLRERMEQQVPEGGICRLKFDVIDHEEKAVPLSSLLTLKVTLYDKATASLPTGPFINGRNAQSILNVNGGTVTEAGGVTTAVLVLAGLDHPIVTAGTRAEWHVVYFEWTWIGGAGPGRKEIKFRVLDLARVA